MNERLRELRIALNLSQEEIGNRIGIESRAHISALENGRRKITDRVIADICREFKVNEHWLRIGEGDMFRIAPDEDETAAYVSELLENKENPFHNIILGIMKTYDQLDPRGKETLEKFSEDLVKNLHNKKED